MMDSAFRDHGTTVTAPSTAAEMYPNSSPGAQRQRNMKYGFSQVRPRTASGDSGTSSQFSTPTSPTSQLPPLPSSPIFDHSANNSFSSQRSFPTYSNPTSDPKPFPLFSTPQPPILHHKPSEASRLRALDQGGRLQSVENSPTPEYQDFSRPRQASGGLRKEPSRPRLQASNTFPLRQQDESTILPPPKFELRDRGLTTSSSNTPTPQAYPTLRPSMSIPDYHAAESIHSRQRNLNSATYKSARIPSSNSRTDVDYNPQYRAYATETDEIRASIRSAFTTNSSFLGTSGTERSSVLTRSSTTSIYGLDEGMSVDDAIGMYESGFQDSGVEDNDELERSDETATAQRKREQGLFEAMNDSMLSELDSDAGMASRQKLFDQKSKPPPLKTSITNDDLELPSPLRAIQTAMLVRDSGAFFKPGGLDTPKASPTVKSGFNFDDNTEIEEGYFSGKTSSRPGTENTQYTPDPTRDRYGFKKETQYTTREQYDAWDRSYTEYIDRRRRKWVALQKASGLITVDPDRFPQKSVKMKRFVRKGIPPEWRGAAWFYYGGGPEMVAKYPGVYDNLVKRALAGEVTQTDDEIIERDLNRTFPDNIHYKPDPAEGESRDPGQQAPETSILRSLRRVLQAFAIHNPRIGYCQSMNFLAGLLLLFMDEEKSFWMLNIITRVYLPGTHDVNLEGANVDLHVLMVAIKDMMPQIWSKIGGELDGTPFSNQSMRLPPITLCTTAWFMSCFIGNLPIETTLRVWDSFFYEGSKTLFRIALTVFKLGEPEIKAVTDPMEIFQVVQGIPRKLLDANLVMESCFKRRNGFGHISQETIEKGRADRRKAYAQERERIANGGTDVSPTRPPGRKNTLFNRRRRVAGEA